ncbi:MAG: redoxin domain-containing protein, partial [Phycisphaerae bacterium]|nr:redoxin domain-containing protein [Phycisphaerae bacterium]
MFKLLVTLVMAASLSTSIYAQTEAPSEIPIPPTPPKTPKTPKNPKNPREKSHEKKTAEVGEQAPEFELVDQNGNTHTLEEYKGKIVVLEWFREKCPYCKHTWESGLIPKLIRDLKDMDSEVVYLAVNSPANAPKEEVIAGGKE